MLRHTPTVALFLAALAVADGQWINYKTPGIPRTADGKPNLAAPAPRVNGKPDLSGLWQTDFAPPGEIERMIPGIGLLAVPGDDPTMIPKYFFNVLADYKPDEITMSPEAAKIFQTRAAAPIEKLCLPEGVPMGDLLPIPRRLIQTPALIAVLAEVGNPPRQIHIDGRPLPIDPQPAWLGYSVGKWEEDTLVVETVGLTDRGQLDGMGHPHSPDVRITERLRRRDFGHMEIQVTITDPKFYSKPIAFKYTQTLVPDDDLLETVCENEKDLTHLRK